MAGLWRFGYIVRFTIYQVAAGHAPSKSNSRRLCGEVVFCGDVLTQLRLEEAVPLNTVLDRCIADRGI